MGQQKGAIKLLFCVKYPHILPKRAKFTQLKSLKLPKNTIQEVIKLQQKVNMKFVVILFTFALYPLLNLQNKKFRFTR